MSVRILQFGTTGQVAREMIAQAPRHGVALTALSRAEADFADTAAVLRALTAHPADLIVVAAAHTAVDQAESEPETARRINAETPAAIARWAQAGGAALVGFSTDYVFDGEKGAPYREEDLPNPLSVYGLTKLEGEQLMLAACARCLVLRTSWVVSSHGRNFVRTMLRLGREGAPLKVVDDQIGRPTSAADLAGFVLGQAGALAAAPAGSPIFGLHHFANAGETSWCGFARAIFELAWDGRAPTVAAIATADRPSPARRPASGVLDTTRLERTFGVTPRPWREALREILAELAAREGEPAA